MKKIMVLVMVVGSFWVEVVWGDMERVSVVEIQKQGATTTDAVNQTN